MPQQFEGKSPSKEKVEILLNEVDQGKIFFGVVSTLLGLALFVFGFMNLTYGILDPAWSPFMIFIGVLILILGFWTMHKGNEYQTIRI
jgi:hypothetical protein